MANVKVDPFALDLEVGKKATKAIKGEAGGLGTPCPNKNWGKPCAVCERAKRLFNTKSPADREEALKIYAKKTPFCNVEFLNERGKVYLMVLPVNAATAYLEGVYETKLWGNPAHPAPQKGDNSSGAPLVLTKKTEGGFNKYSLTPNMSADAASRRVSSREVLNNCYDLDNIINDVEEGKIDNMFLPRRDLSVGQSVSFKILPRKNAPSGVPIEVGYYHYGVTKDEVRGKATPASMEVEDTISTESVGGVDDMLDLGDDLGDSKGDDDLFDLD